jgi:hypothetical protein
VPWQDRGVGGGRDFVVVFGEYIEGQVDQGRGGRLEVGNEAVSRSGEGPYCVKAALTQSCHSDADL